MVNNQRGTSSPSLTDSKPLIQQGMGINKKIILRLADGYVGSDTAKGKVAPLKNATE